MCYCIPLEPQKLLQKCTGLPNVFSYLQTPCRCLRYSRAHPMAPMFRHPNCIYLSELISCLSVSNPLAMLTRSSVQLLRHSIFVSFCMLYGIASGLQLFYQKTWVSHRSCVLSASPTGKPRISKTVLKNYV